MSDIKLNNEGDIDVNEYGDISLSESVKQQILIRLRWIKGEWRLGPELGFSWYEDVWVKNPNIRMIQQLIRSEIMSVDGVENAKIIKSEYDAKRRKATFKFAYSVGEENYNDEVTINV